ncbi:hypothetical protein FIBSPDRAFT_992917 [Athelia psychrophila]|uniref:Homeobox domain-containing protein n=1 Tax=Athelia psychrophila TaxID=1759441 RepID=A0A166RYL3_9AGAM|nr:hypothetical protein FIBSPDRAFT_992917 [Fibularhizoctonia sp. CBS 109695]
MPKTSLSSVGKNATSVPYARRKVTPEQLVALNLLFEVKSHPSREDRVALAIQMDMELKTVTNWFQNRRQTSKRRSRALSSRGPAISQNASKTSLPARKLHPSISLDNIAGLHEREIKDTTPSTPSKPQRSASFGDHDEIWAHMLSSPCVPPSSPSAERVRMLAVPPNSRTRRSLEWACARARADKSRWKEGLLDVEDDKQTEVSEETDNETESEADEAITPNASANFCNFATPYESNGHLNFHDNQNVDSKAHAASLASDVEAAMLLLGFMGRQSNGV